MTTYDFDTLPDWLDIDSIPTAADEFPGWIRDLRDYGTSSGQYMPAVTYYDAKRTMGQHGDEVVEYIYELWGPDLPEIETGMSWGQICCHYLCIAVELWAGQVCCELGID